MTYPIPKKKKRKIHSREECLTLAQKLAKLRMVRDYGRLWCISCGVPLGSDAQGGHYIHRQDRATETEPDNIWCQCPKCNTYLSGNLIAYRENLIRRIGIERVQRLEDMSSARKGSDEALERLSEKDKRKATMIKSAFYYDNLWYELNAEIKKIQDEL